MKRHDALAYRNKIESAASYLPDEEAVNSVALYPVWESGKSYITGQRMRHNNILYKVLQDHNSQEDWTPDVSPSLFAKVLIPDPEVIPEWEQPDSTNPYMIGDKVTHNGKTWKCTQNYNVFEPGTAGWIEVTE